MSAIHDALPIESRTEYRARCSCGWDSGWVEVGLVANELRQALGDLIDEHRDSVER